MTQNKRRKILLGGATVAASGISGLPNLALAQAKEVKVAIAVPLSGAWARNGELHLKGAQMAIEDINAAGGIKETYRCRLWRQHRKG
jgi:branched-chain amino acid transport system substrate-binding protein